MERVVEQLRVAEEELRAQNEELRAHREATEVALRQYRELFDLAPDPYVTTDRLGQIREANIAAAELLNIPQARLTGRQLISCVAPGLRRGFRTALQRIASGQDPLPGGDEWTVKIKPPRKPEVEVSVAASAVRGRDGSIVSIRWLFRDVTSRRRAELDLRSLNAELESRVAERTAALEGSNWAKAEFLSVMAHELRTPLNAIMGYTELIEMGIPGPVTMEQSAHLGRIRSSGKRLVGLVNEILDLGKVEAGQLHMDRSDCAIGDAINAALDVVIPDAATRSIRLINECSNSASHCYIGDQTRVEQILINLLANAIKFTGSGGVVKIVCSREFRAEVSSPNSSRNGWLALRVIDTGIGMSPENLTRVFDPFVQVEQPLTRTRGGTGLGLTIGRRLARLMGGDLTVESELGKGSTFTLWLPFAEGAEAETPEELERRSPARYAQGLTRLGNALLEEIESVVHAYSRKLLQRGGIKKARDLTRSELEDHAAAFLADIARALVAVEDARGGPSGVMRDGSVLRRIIAERHGAQRQRLGFTEEELRREFRILRKCVEEGIVRASERDELSGDPAGLTAARTVLNRLLDTAEEISVRGYRLAAMDEFQNIKPIN